MSTLGADAAHASATIMNRRSPQVKQDAPTDPLPALVSAPCRRYCWGGLVTISSTSHWSSTRSIVKVTWSL